MLLLEQDLNVVTQSHTGTIYNTQTKGTTQNLQTRNEVNDRLKMIFTRLTLKRTRYLSRCPSLASFSCFRIKETLQIMIQFNAIKPAN